MVPDTDDEIAMAMRAKLATLDARLAVDAAELDDEGRALVDAVRAAAAGLARAIEVTEGNAR